MEVLVYNSEKFTRSKWWYVIFASTFAIVFFLTLFYQNYVGAVLLFFLLGGYFYYSSIHAQVVSFVVQSDGIKVANVFTGFSSLIGYVLELDPKTQLIKNIVIISSKGHIIYTFHDTPQHIQAFILSLDKFLPMLDTYEQSSFEKIIRRLQL